MDQHLAVIILFLAATISAGIDAFRSDIFPKVQKTALAVCFAAMAFLVEVTHFLGG